MAKRVTLNIAVLYTASYFTVDDRGCVAKAKEVLDGYGIDLKVWPDGGKKGSGNMLGDFVRPIAHDKDAYMALRLRVNEAVRRGGGFSVFMPAVFSQYVHPGYGITPPMFKLVTPGCLIAPTGNKDGMDMLHEIGHGAGCDHDHGDASNFMYEVDGRSTINQEQLEKLRKASFASA